VCTGRIPTNLTLKGKAELNYTHLPGEDDDTDNSANTLSTSPPLAAAPQPPINSLPTELQYVNVSFCALMSLGTHVSSSLAVLQRWFSWLW